MKENQAERLENCQNNFQDILPNSPKENEESHKVEHGCGERLGYSMKRNPALFGGRLNPYCRKRNNVCFYYY